MPGILLLLDDWEPHNKITALEALVYIINNVAGSELRCTGRAAVIYEAAKHHLYSRDPELLQAAYPTATAAAVVLQQDPSIAHSAQLSAAEEVLSMLLRDMVFEQRLDLRSVYVTNLPAALSAAGIRSVRWQDQVVQVLCNYLTTFEGASARDRLCALKALQVYSSECWPQAGRQRDEILKALLQLVYTSTAEGPLQLQPKVLEEVLDECRQCVQQLLLCQPPPEPNLLTGLDSLALPAALQQNVHRVFEIPIKEQIVK
ncbi:uncharacterized protein LOC108676657 isoform X2 [Hyalella azteca]|nr:uncharacterized protein LOC108676657 isoform X2 [Hyalella azteca]